MTQVDIFGEKLLDEQLYFFFCFETVKVGGVYYVRKLQQVSLYGEVGNLKLFAILGKLIVEFSIEIAYLIERINLRAMKKFFV